MAEQDSWEEGDNSMLAGFEEDGRQFLSFSLGGEDYGIDIFRVQEIRGWSEVRKIPGSPPWILGILKLRGNIIPIVDMRLRFDLEVNDTNERTVIIILNLGDEEDSQDVGIVVDEVADVMGAAEDDIRPAPRMGGNVDTEYLEGIATVRDSMLMLLDAPRLFRGWELEELRQLGEL
ncbi:purine-binding chemotaxis protein CheW [Natronospira proteinivora]|uniref:Chemotaxis protein CheW n=1 Tax=Natronospira proteinivora TaxID=1807133 RepID=A0ABT1G5B3_9GAMM|nr:chemotaxis protein CheW [Natronospira proteinivora]MCP1726466.1 purine-binding chemotaxis protein CheW [Natronospira proteinivora]